MSEPRRHDLHTHFYPREFFDLVEKADSDFSFGTATSGRRFIAYQGTRFFSVTPPMSDMRLRLEAMDRAGVDVAVLSVGPLTQFIRDVRQQVKMARLLNDRYAELMAEHPERINGFATVPLADTREAVFELHRTVGELGFRGVIVPSNVVGTYYDDPRFQSFLSEANQMGLCVFMHPLVPPGNEALRDYVLGSIVGFMFDTTVSVARLVYSGLLATYPNIRWLIAHAGGAVPWLMERIDNGWRDYDENRVRLEAPPSSYLKGLYYDTVTFSPHTLRMLRDVVGTDHMAMGTDYPHPLGGIDKGVASIEALNIPDSEKANVFQNTALSILNNG